MDKKHDMTEALARRRKMAASHAPVHGAPAPAPAAALDDKVRNTGEGEEAPEGGTPGGVSGMLGAAGGGGEVELTPEMLMELLGSINAPGLRGRVMQNAQTMTKKC